MIRLDADKSVQFCDGFRRRDFLHAGTLGMLGFGLTNLFCSEGARRGSRRQRAQYHSTLSGRRTQSVGYLGHEARGPVRDSWTVQTN